MDTSMDWKRCVQVYCTNCNDAADSNSYVRVIGNVIQERKLHLIELIEELEATITSTDISLRERGVKLLSEVINSFPKDFLTSKEVESMAEFLMLRLQDHHTIVPHALQGLLVLSQSSNLPKEYASKIILSIFKEVHVPSQLQNDRYAVYQIIATLLQHHLEDLKTIDSMVFGFIQVLDGERDPRCLLLAFHIIPQLVKHFNIGPFAEDLFEVIACYFPVIDFPSSGKNVSITKEELTAALHRCLTLTPKFAPYLLPLLIEKLESYLPAARLHAYHVLEGSCRVFSREAFIPFLKPLWEFIRKEVFMGHNEELENAALKSLTALVRAISPLNSEDDMENLLDYLQEILKECEHHLCQPELMLVPYSGKILTALISASAVAADKIFSSVMPLLLQQYAVQTQAQILRSPFTFRVLYVGKLGHRKAILDITMKLVISMKQINGCKPLEKFHDSVISLFFSVLDDSTSQELSNLGLSALCEALDIKYFLEERHLELLAHHLIHILVSGERESLRVPCNTVLSKLSSLHPTVTLTHVMPILKKQLYELDVSDTQSFSKILEAFVSASSHTEVLKESLESLISFFDEQMLGKISTKNSVLTANSLLRAIECHLPTNQLPLLYVKSCVIEPLIRISLRTAFAEDLMDTEKLETIEVVCDAIHKIICISDFSVTAPFFEALIQLHLSGRMPEIFTMTNSFSNSQMNSPSSKAVSLLLLRCILTSMPQSNCIPNLPALLEHLKVLTIENEDFCISKLGAQCISIIINKMEDHVELQLILNSFYEYLIHSIDEPDSGCRRVQNVLLLWIWISKALVLRSHPQMVSFINKLISWFKSDPLGNTAAGGISTIVEDHPKVFCTDGHAHVKLLYRQRFFIETSPQLCKGYNEASQNHKSNYLIALCSQLKHLPKTVLISELPSLLPLMLQSLHHSSMDLQLAVLTCLEDILKDDPSLLQEQLNDFVPRLLTLASSQSSMKVKIHSLSCLACLCSIPCHFLLPLRQDVIQKLKPCLDDKKRLVRKAAVEARCKWYLIGQPGS